MAFGDRLFNIGIVMDSESQIISESKRNCSIFKGSCFERLGGYLTIPFKQVLKNLPLFRGQSVNPVKGSYSYC
jgi:hypothetical protein